MKRKLFPSFVLVTVTIAAFAVCAFSQTQDENVVFNLVNRERSRADPRERNARVRESSDAARGPELDDAGHRPLHDHVAPSLRPRRRCGAG